MTEKNESRTAAISNAYRTRIANLEEAGTVKAEPKQGPKDLDGLPDESWKKDDILDFLESNGVIESREDVKGQTKADLLENFVDAEG